MTNLLWKTRAGSSPAGKPRVYFCAHPAEKGTYLEQASNELLDLYNCAVFYTEEGMISRDDLRDMNLVVVAVTNRFLKEQTYAMEEFRIAQELRLHILPLLMESGLEDRFNEVYGELQCLTPNVAEKGALSYREKLRRFVEPVLLREDRTELVRQAFRKRIFLSYRKKDRGHARKLMEAIHNCPGFEDVSIWYDEYLVPGENFNREIEKALKGSHLFLLMATDHVLEEGNYVLTCEYPMAKDLLPMLSVEMDSTDRERLLKTYDALDGSMTLEGLEQGLREKLGLGTCEEDPDREYLIGVGYLLGVEVEADQERAVKLITSAAQKGSLNAMMQLAQMYQYGIGIKRDLDKAMRMRRTILDLLRDRPEKAAEAATNLAELLWDLRRLEEARDVYQEALILSQECGRHQEELICLGRLGDIAEQLNDVDTAEHWYRLRLDRSNALAEELHDERSKGEVAMSSARMVSLLEKQGAPEKALELLHKSIELFRELTEGENGLAARRELAICLGRKGDLLRYRSPEEAKACYLESAKMLCVVAEESRIHKHRMDLAITWEHLADLCLEMGDFEEGTRWIEKTLEISRSLADTLGTVEARSKYACSLIRRGDMLRKKKDFDGAEQAFMKCLRIHEQLVEQTGMEKYRIALVEDHIHLFDLSMDRKDLTAAELWLETAKDQLELLQKKPANPLVTQNVFLWWEHKGYLLVRQNKEEEAACAYRKALELGERMLQEEDNGRNRYRLAQSLFNLHGLVGEVELLERVLELLEAVQQYDVWVLLLDTGRKLWQEERLSHRTYQNVCLICRDAARMLEGKEPGRWTDHLMNWLIRSGDMWMERFGADFAVNCFRSYLEIVKQREDPWDLAFGYEKLAGALLRDDRVKEALELMKCCREQDLALLDLDFPKALPGAITTLQNLIIMGMGEEEDSQVQEWCSEGMNLCHKAERYRAHPNVEGAMERFLDMIVRLYMTMTWDIQTPEVADECCIVCMEAQRMTGRAEYLHDAVELLQMLEEKHPENSRFNVYRQTLEYYMKSLGIG